MDQSIHPSVDLFDLAASLLSGGQPSLHPNQGLSVIICSSPSPIGVAKKILEN